MIDLDCVAAQPIGTLPVTISMDFLGQVFAWLVVRPGTPFPGVCVLITYCICSRVPNAQLQLENRLVSCHKLFIKWKVNMYAYGLTRTMLGQPRTLDDF